MPEVHAPRSAPARPVAALLVAALVGFGATACMTPRPSARSARRRSTGTEALNALRSFCADGGALTISDNPAPPTINALLDRVNTAYDAAGPGQHLHWLATDLAAAAHDAATGHRRSEQDDLYAALGAVSGHPSAACVRHGTAP